MTTKADAGMATKAAAIIPSYTPVTIPAQVGIQSGLPTTIPAQAGIQSGLPTTIPAEAGIQQVKESLPATHYQTGCRVKPGMTTKADAGMTTKAVAGMAMKPVAGMAMVVVVGMAMLTSHLRHLRCTKSTA